MAATKTSSRTKSSESTPAAVWPWALVGVAVVALLAWWLWNPTPPQMGADKEVMSAVDAFYTAVTSRREELLNACETRLHKLRDENKLPTESAAFLDGIIAQCRAGDWEPAAKKLYRFVQAQQP